MSVQRKYPKDEFARRGDAIYQAKVLPGLAASDHLRFCALDLESEQFEVADDELTAVRRLRSRLPQSQTWVVRVGMPFVKRIGLRSDFCRRFDPRLVGRLNNRFRPASRKMASRLDA